METVESKLKDIIIERYGSLKRFTDNIDMPWSTLDSILKRGIINSNINNVLKITEALNLSAEALAYGSIQTKPKPDDKATDSNLINDGSKDSFIQNQLLTEFNQLNNAGKSEAVNRVSELTYIPQYIENNVVPIKRKTNKYIPTEDDIKSLVARNGKKLTREEAIDLISSLFSEDENL
ncbi:MAG: hypothetical protein K0R92_387 [Lachnospiraceae bacterium]|jgi:hypothetical protein|nr:hypothetical protein [Lachnospiraceae bacterium]